MPQPITTHEPCPKCRFPKTELVETWTQQVEHIPYLMKLYRCKDPKCGHEFTKTAVD